MEAQHKECPKCRTRMHRVVEIGSGNSIERDVTTGIYHAWKCHNCATWIDIMDIANTRPVAKGPDTKKGNSTDVSSVIRAAVMPAVPEIKRLRGLKKGWDYITQYLNLPCTKTAVQRHYLEITGIKETCLFGSNGQLETSRRIHRTILSKWVDISAMLDAGVKQRHIFQRIGIEGSLSALYRQLAIIRAEKGGGVAN